MFQSYDIIKGLERETEATKMRSYFHPSCCNLA